MSSDILNAILAQLDSLNTRVANIESNQEKILNLLQNSTTKVRTITPQDVSFAHTPTTTQVQRPEPKALNEQTTQEILEGDRVINFFINERRRLQGDFAHGINTEKWKYDMRVHLAEGKRTAKQYYAMIRWLYSGDEEAKFWRDSINNINSLIKNFDAVEMKFISKNENQDRAKAASMYASVLRKKGMSDDEILKVLQKENLV